MNMQSSPKLVAIINREREALLSRWREQVRQLPSAKHLDAPSLNDHIPVLLDELVKAFESALEQTIPKTLLSGSPPSHGIVRWKEGFDIAEIVAEYNILRSCIYDLAEKHGISLHGNDFYILNRVLDEAIGIAVQAFAAEQALEVQRRREEYLTFLAHDLRTPLTAIYLAIDGLDVAISKSDRSAKATQMLDLLHRSAERVLALVEGVLKENAHIRTKAGMKLERREFDLWPLVESIIHDLHPVAEASSTQLVNQIPADLIAYADASLLKRVFQNLIANAIKYTPRGEIVIGARGTGADGSIECWVSDDGAGIPEDRLETIFEKFETDAERDDGIGLGLAIVRSLVEAHGGKISVENGRDAGSIFRFTLAGRAKGNDAPD